MQNKKTYTDFIITELNKGNVKYNDVCLLFCTKFDLTKQTFNKFWKLANEEYKEQRQTIETEKLITTIEIEKQAVESNILTKNEALEILSEIAKDKRNESSANERRGAIETISKIQGWNAPTEQTINLNDKPPIFGENSLTD
jgi:hypothetical protein